MIQGTPLPLNITTVAGGVDNDSVPVAVVLNGEVVVHETEVVVPERSSMGHLPGTWQLIVGAQALAEWIQLGGIAAQASEPDEQPAPKAAAKDEKPADEGDDEPAKPAKKAAAKKPAKKKAAKKADDKTDEPPADLLD